MYRVFASVPTVCIYIPFWNARPFASAFTVLLHIVKGNTYLQLSSFVGLFPTCRVLVVWSSSLVLSCLFSVKLEVFLLIQHFQKPCGSPVYVTWFVPLQKRVPISIKRLHLDTRVNPWTSPNFLNLTKRSSHTLGLISEHTLLSVKLFILLTSQPNFPTHWSVIYFSLSSSYLCLSLSSISSLQATRGH